MRRVVVEQQSWIMKGIWCLPTLIFMALVAGFPWQTQAQTPCPRASQCIPTRWCSHRHFLGKWRYLWLRVQRDCELGWWCYQQCLECCRRPDDDSHLWRTWHLHCPNHGVRDAGQPWCNLYVQPEYHRHRTDPRSRGTVKDDDFFTSSSRWNQRTRRLLDLTCLLAAADPKAPMYWYLISRQRLFRAYWHLVFLGLNIR